MTHLPDPFEAELEALRPAELSPELFARVDLALAHQAEPRRARRWFIGAMTTAAAACVVVSALLLVSRTAEPSGPGASNQIATTFPSPSPVEEEDDRPVLASYQRALSRSPESFDALLDRHAAQRSGRSPSPTTFTLASNAELIH